jgi:lipid-binding SYLF domain-containing protein
MTRVYMSRRAFVATSLGTGLIAVAGCTTTTPSDSQTSSPQTSQAKRTELNAAANGALDQLYRQEPGSRGMVQQAKGTLIFPKVFKAGLIVGGEYGEGVLRVGGNTVDYYSATAGSLGLTAGAEQKAVFILFMTDDALNKFRQSSGWTAGADASVAMVNVGAAGSASTQTAQRPVIGYVLTQGGLMVDASLNGTKISKLAM